MYDSMYDLLTMKPIRFRAEARIVRDPVWGPISVAPHELVVLDLPLMQRLRACRQDPIADIAFPSATHSVFSHSLGVMHVAELILDSLGKQPGFRVSKTDRMRVRLAALLHDVARPLLGSIARETAPWGHDYIPTASALIRSDPFGALWHQLVATYPYLSVFDPESIAVLLDDSPPESHVYLADAIAGPVGADRIDVLCRDAQATGLQVAWDARELIGAMNVLSHRKGSVRHLGISSVAIGAVEQMAQAMIGLWRDYYMEPDVRRARALASLALWEWIKQSDNVDRASDLLTQSDEAFLSGQVCDSGRSADLVNRLRRGQLPAELLRLDFAKDNELMFPLMELRGPYRIREEWLRDAAEPGPSGDWEGLMLDFPSKPSLRMLYDIPISTPDGSLYSLQQLSPVHDILARATRGRDYVAVYSVSDDEEWMSLAASRLMDVLAKAAYGSG